MEKKLTKRELQILQIAHDGKKVKEIAADLEIAEKTVANHFQNMREKFGVNKISLVVKEAHKNGWIK